MSTGGGKPVAPDQGTPLGRSVWRALRVVVVPAGLAVFAALRVFNTKPTPPAQVFVLFGGFFTLGGVASFIGAAVKGAADPPAEPKDSPTAVKDMTLPGTTVTLGTLVKRRPQTRADLVSQGFTCLAVGLALLLVAALR